MSKSGTLWMGVTCHSPGRLQIDFSRTTTHLIEVVSDSVSRRLAYLAHILFGASADSTRDDINYTSGRTVHPLGDGKSLFCNRTSDTNTFGDPVARATLRVTAVYTMFSGGLHRVGSRSRGLGSPLILARTTTSLMFLLLL